MDLTDPYPDADPQHFQTGKKYHKKGEISWFEVHDVLSGGLLVSPVALQGSYGKNKN
jgi:hypothetical protein